MRDPFLLEPDTVISFSGGRTSAYLLRRHLDAHGGRLPPRVATIFCNTGKERPETLDFVERVSHRWSVEITWLEYRYVDGHHTFEVVSYETASRSGEPFEQLIEARRALPNVRMRFCTGQLKIHTTNRYVRRVLGWDNYVNNVGLRYDEPDRYHRLTAPDPHYQEELTLFGWEEVQVGSRREKVTGEEPSCPLYHARVTRADVMAFWQHQRGGLELEEWLQLPRARRPGWDLELLPDEGNCDLCFLKGLGKRFRLMLRRPDLADWWIEQEAKGLGNEPSARTFRNDRPPYAEILQMTRGGGTPLFGDEDELPCHCTD